MNETTGSEFSWANVGTMLDAIPTTPAGATLTVNHDNVLAAAKIIQTQIEALKDIVHANRQDLIVDPAAEDLVSRDAARAWNYRLAGADDSYAARISAYVDSLNKLVAQLRDSAKTYGFKDEDIAATFGTTGA
ncbi:hypothetical protein [Actinocrispum wychmicini]|uniref:PE family protein n=1 Tax=Actinocrispum wychmicini TaxID=1213861 RepID=A0A4R2JWN8_9PSEU|nr:hypothetical protein [Actinocrispum wychmicini]TCO64883.1 hypothetical protein EV192_101667 [Actinocrispum wychmicini]